MLAGGGEVLKNLSSLCNNKVIFNNRYDPLPRHTVT